ncbi:MAG: ribosome-associated translation inhibitor RaiA [Desulfovibrio sp.]|jgi:putative sigma-54 modulation protein|nr:ribosome-associated translation inhibitor RaiA [Desulfovibrio sp.]
MNISLTFKNFEPSEHLRSYAELRFKKLGRFLHRSKNIELTAVLAVDKFRHKADVQLAGDGIAISAVEQSGDMYATVDMVQDKIEAQLKKHVDRQRDKRRESRRGTGGGDAGPDRFGPDEQGGDVPLIVSEQVEAKPMFADEAALQMGQSDEPVFIFINAETARINVLYKRKQGGFGLIDPGE